MAETNDTNETSNEKELQERPELEEIVSYGDPQIRSGDAKISGWLKFVFFILPIWGILWFYLYWNGSYGWLDRGYWQELQRAANTTFPTQNQDWPKK